MTALHLITPAPTADLPELRNWRNAQAGRSTRLVARDGVWWLDLFCGDRIVAAAGHADPQVALSRALQQAQEGK